MLEVAANPKRLGAQIGFISILHTWGQNLLLHPHIHCVVPSGGFSSDYRGWVRPKYAFFLPVDVLSIVFRTKFVEGLRTLHRKGKLSFAGPTAELRNPKSFAIFLDKLFEKDWIVLCQAGLRWTGSGVALSRPLYPSCGHQQSSFAEL